MKKYTGKSEDILNMIVDWQAIEARNIEYMDGEIPKAKNPLVKMMLQALKLEAEKRCLIQQMIVDSVKKEAVHLSPEELKELSSYINRQVETGEEVLSGAEETFERNELPVPRYLLYYLIADLKRQNDLLSQFDDELKTASIPTSASSKTFGSSKAA